MKRVISIILAATMLLALCACGDKPAELKGTYKTTSASDPLEGELYIAGIDNGSTSTISLSAGDDTVSFYQDISGYVKSTGKVREDDKATQYQFVITSSFGNIFEQQEAGDYLSLIYYADTQSVEIGTSGAAVWFTKK